MWLQKNFDFFCICKADSTSANVSEKNCVENRPNVNASEIDDNEGGTRNPHLYLGRYRRANEEPHCTPHQTAAGLHSADSRNDHHSAPEPIPRGRCQHSF